MADADQGGVWQAFAEQGVHGVFQAFVHGGAGFIEEDDGGLGEEGAADGEALLLAEREDAAPVGVFVEAGDQVRQLAAA